MKRFYLLPLLLLGFFLPASTWAQESPLVHAVFFFSPTCSHCHEVIDNVLPPLHEQYGDSFVLLSINTTQGNGSALYNRTVTHFQIPQNRRGVPTIVIGETVLVGSEEIPAQLPALIERGLANGGTPLPAVPGIETAVSADLNATTTNDGFGLAWLILLGLLGSLGFTGWRFGRAWPQVKSKAPVTLSSLWLLPLLVVAGVLVAGYLSYVDLTRTTAVCGPFGECDAVQSSAYAQIAGIPVALLGLLAYLTIGLLWLGRNGRFANTIPLFILAIAATGTLFSIYLTILELFVIEAVCAWCLASAAIIGTLMVMIAGRLPVKRPLATTRRKRRYRHS